MIVAGIDLSDLNDNIPRPVQYLTNDELIEKLKQFVCTRPASGRVLVMDSLACFTDEKCNHGR